jgi:hypothetical protein
MSDERIDALDSLLKSPGWKLFTEHLDGEWGPNGKTYQANMDKALDLTDAEAAASQARQVRAARLMVERFSTWPVEELARLRRVANEREAVLGRGGYR